MLPNGSPIEDFSSSDEEDSPFDKDMEQDMEAIKFACMATGTNPDEIVIDKGGCRAARGESYDSEDDLELLRSIRSRFSVSEHACPSVSDDDEDQDDFQTLRAIQMRFSAFDAHYTTKNIAYDLKQKPEQVNSSAMASENVTFSDIVNKTITCEGFPESQQYCLTISDIEEARSSVPIFSGNGESMITQSSDKVEQDLSASCQSSDLRVWDSNFPQSGRVFINAIKMNRSYQRFLRKKLTQLEARIEENKKLKERLKILRDFQISCKKVMGRALSQKKDLIVLLISGRKAGVCDNSEVNDKKLRALHHGPAENCHVANYNAVLTKYPLPLDCRKWSREEIKNLVKGVRQQFQERLIQVAIDDRFSSGEGSSGDANLDSFLESIKDLEVTPELLRQFLPKVNWDQLASMYIVGRSGTECEARWLNWEDPLINRNQWTAEEDKNLLLLVQEKGIKNWHELAVLLGTNRTPFQCLARYQRSLNSSILRKEWTEEEDDQLRLAVQTFGEHDWQSVASMLGGRTGVQCSNRWMKQLHPIRKRVGRWTLEEDKRLKVTVMLFGPKNWKKISQFVPGRTQVQCRERWVNSLDPSLNLGEWTEEEDSKLKALVAEFGYSWSKIASQLPPRTDNQCWRRWKILVPDNIPLLKEERIHRKTVLLSNFVGREKERSTLRPCDFIPLIKDMVSGVGIKNLSTKRKGKSRKKAKIKSQELLGIGGGTEVEVVQKGITVRNTKAINLCLRKKFYQPIGDHLSLHAVSESLMTTKRKKRSSRCGKRKRNCGSVESERIFGREAVRDNIDRPSKKSRCTCPGHVDAESSEDLNSVCVDHSHSQGSTLISTISDKELVANRNKCSSKQPSINLDAENMSLSDVTSIRGSACLSLQHFNVGNDGNPTLSQMVMTKRKLKKMRTESNDLTISPPMHKAKLKKQKTVESSGPTISPLMQKTRLKKQKVVESNLSQIMHKARLKKRKAAASNVLPTVPVVESDGMYEDSDCENGTN